MRYVMMMLACVMAMAFGCTTEAEPLLDETTMAVESGDKEPPTVDLSAREFTCEEGNRAAALDPLAEMLPNGGSNCRCDGMEWWCCDYQSPYDSSWYTRCESAGGMCGGGEEPGPCRLRGCGW